MGLMTPVLSYFNANRMLKLPGLPEKLQNKSIEGIVDGSDGDSDSDSDTHCKLLLAIWLLWIAPNG